MSRQYDPNEHFSSDERPPRDISEESQNGAAAMEAANRLFSDPGSAPQPFIDDEPPPRQEVLGVAREKAEAFFKKPDPVAADVPAPQTSSPPIDSDQPSSDDLGATAQPVPPALVGSQGEPKPRILADLSAGPDELETRLAAAAATRRGRKPGSKNKPKVAAELDGSDKPPPRRQGRPPKVQPLHPSLFDPDKSEAAPPPTAAPLYAKAQAEPEAADLPLENEDEGDVVLAPAPPVQSSSVVNQQLAHTLVANYRARPSKTATAKPGERWKRRLRFLK